MDDNADKQFIVIQAAIEDKKKYMKSNKKDSDEKIMRLIEDFKSMLASSITSITDQINALKSSLTQNYLSKPMGLITVIPADSMAPPLDGGQSTKIGGM